MRTAARRSMLAVLVTCVFLLGQASAQPAIPNGVFVRDGAGSYWLVLDGQRVGVPVFATGQGVADDLPISARWIIPADNGGLTLGNRPAWHADPIASLWTDREIIPGVAGQTAVGQFRDMRIQATAREMTVARALPAAPGNSDARAPRAAAGKFVIVLVTAENVSATPDCCMPDFRLRDARGRFFTGETETIDPLVKHAAAVVYPVPYIRGDYQPNVPVQAVFVFDVALDATNLVLMPPER
jgi:hypothetical protein